MEADEGPVAGGQRECPWMPLSQVQQRPSPDPQVCAPILGSELHFPDTPSSHCGPGTQPRDRAHTRAHILVPARGPVTRAHTVTSLRNLRKKDAPNVGQDRSLHPL